MNAPLGLLRLALAFWVVFASLLGGLAAGGHCIDAAWSLTPVCGGRFWWTVVTSPELLIFVFFMITDPRTVPAGGRSRHAFGAAVGYCSVLLLAPQTTEFGAKVGLLGGLVVACGARSMMGGLPSRVVSEARQAWPRRTWRRGVALIAVAAVALSSVTIAGTSARDPSRLSEMADGPDARALVPAVDPSRVPTVIVDEDAATAFGPLIGPDPRAVGLDLLLALDGESLALGSGDASLLEAVDHGLRLTEMRERLERGPNPPLITDYDFETMRLIVVRRGGQSGLRLAVEGTGTIRETNGPRSAASRFSSIFTLRIGADGRWLLIDVRDR